MHWRGHPFSGRGRQGRAGLAVLDGSSCQATVGWSDFPLKRSRPSIFCRLNRINRAANTHTQKTTPGLTSFPPPDSSCAGRHQTTAGPRRGQRSGPKHTPARTFVHDARRSSHPGFHPQLCVRNGSRMQLRSQRTRAACSSPPQVPTGGSHGDNLPAVSRPRCHVAGLHR